MRAIAVIVVSWNDAAELESAVASLAAARAAVPAGGPRISLTVVVNGPTDVRREKLLESWPDATMIFNAENRGFGPAATQGAARADGDVLLFLNPDTRAEGDPFSPIARAFEAHPEAVAVAPRLVESDGSGGERASPPLSPPGREDQFTFQLRRLPSLLSDARELLLWDHLFPNNPGRRRFRYADADRATPFPVEQPAGAALAVRADVFRSLGGFAPELAPAWFEDVDLCARLAASGTILYWPEARFQHRGGVSSDQLGYARFLPIYYSNAIAYRKRHYGLLARAAYRGLLAVGMFLRLALLPLRGSDPRPKGDSARAYLRVFRLAFAGGARFPASAP